MSNRSQRNLPVPPQSSLHMFTKLGGCVLFIFVYTFSFGANCVYYKYPKYLHYCPSRIYFWLLFGSAVLVGLGFVIYELGLYSRSIIILKLRLPYYDIWEVQNNTVTKSYYNYYKYVWRGGHELEERIFVFVSIRMIIFGF